MKIIRNGVEIELTSGEVYSAFLEQQHEFDVVDIIDKIEDERDAYGDSADVMLAYVDNIADDMRRNIDKYDMGWRDARDAAIADFSLSDYQMDD